MRNKGNGVSGIVGTSTGRKELAELGRRNLPDDFIAPERLVLEISSKNLPLMSPLREPWGAS